jgi:hypothetical protein
MLLQEIIKLEVFKKLYKNNLFSDELLVETIKYLKITFFKMGSTMIHNCI